MVESTDPDSCARTFSKSCGARAGRAFCLPEFAGQIRIDGPFWGSTVGNEYIDNIAESKYLSVGLVLGGSAGYSKQLMYT
jgi:hypothetical protein